MNNLTPRRTFFIDGTGALISATFLGYILVEFNEYVGMPINTLRLLAAIAKFFAAYSFINYFIKPKNWSFYLKLIATANAIYCLITLVLVVYYMDLLSYLGLVYFLGEILVIIGIVKLEMKVAKHAK